MQQRRVFVQFQQVNRQVIRFQREGFGQIALPRRHFLFGQSGNQVKAEVGEPGDTSQPDGLARFGG